MYICSLMKTIFTISALIISGLCFARQAKAPLLKPDKQNKEIFRAIPEENKAKPNYDLSAYLISTLKYPKAAQEAEIEGQVLVAFIVEKDGSISIVDVVKGKDLGGGLPEEAVRVVKNMPAWKPAIQNDVKVKCHMTIPINFRLEDKSRLNSKYQFPVDKGVVLIQGALPTFNYPVYIHKQQLYPEQARKNRVQGLVVVRFIVETDSSISNITIAEGQDLGYGLPEEALRLIRNMPAWQPALDIDKKPVRSYVMAPVSFKLDEE